MPKPKAHGRPHSRTSSSTSVVKLSALTPANRQDSAQRIGHHGPPQQQPSQQQPPKKAKQNGRPQSQPPVLQPAQRRPATPPSTQPPNARQLIESPSGTTEDEWESSESNTVTPNPEPADDRPAAPDVTTPRLEDEPGPATPKPTQKPPLLDMNAAAVAAMQQRQQSSSNASFAANLPPLSARQPLQMPMLLNSPAIAATAHNGTEQPNKTSPARRPRPHSAIFLPAGAGMTPLVPQPRRDSVDEDSTRARHRHANAQHRLSLNVQPGSGISSPHRPTSIHSIAAYPSRPHPLLRGLSHSAVSSSTVGPLLTSDPAHATLSPNPATSIAGSQPSSPNSQSSRAGTSSISGRLFRRPSVSSIKSVATLPATATGALSTSPSASSTTATASGTFGRPRTLSTTSSSAALSSLAHATAHRPASPPPIWKTSIVFGGQQHHHHLADGGAFTLLDPDVRAQHAAVAAWHAPGLASFERVVSARMARAKAKPQ